MKRIAFTTFTIIILFSILTVLSLLSPSSIKAAEQEKITEQKSGNQRLLSIRKGYKGVFITTEDSILNEKKFIGRLAVKLLRGNLYQQVPYNYLFRSGDMIRFEVTSNHNCWVFVYYQPPGEGMQKFWPKQDLLELDVNAPNFLIKNTPVYIPTPGAIQFDEHSGQESFYVAVKSKSAVQLSDKKNPLQTKHTYALKSGSNVEKVVLTSQSFLPSPEESDQYLYFTPSENGNGETAAIKFSLAHE